MHGAPRAIGVGPPIRLGGRLFSVRGRRIRDYAAIEARILELRGNPFNTLRWLAASGWSEAFIRERISALRFSDWWSVGYSECMDWLGTWDGRIYGLALVTDSDWDLIRTEVVRECDAAIRQRGQYGPEIWWASIQNALDIANGDDEVGALDWLARPNMGDNKKSETSFWIRLFDILSQEPFSFPLSEIAEMTMNQVRMLCRGEMKINCLADAIHYERQRREGIDKAVKNVMNCKHWSS